MEQRAKELAYKRYTSNLEYLRTRPKCKDYGQYETADTIWDKLPYDSKQYWLQRVA